MSARRVLVVGGGAAGAIGAVHLLREARTVGATELEVLVVDRDGDLGPGVAYDTDDPLHLLNVPACRMGAISSHPEHFHEWQRERVGAPADAFLPRGLFGQYLRELVATAEAEADGATLTLRQGEVVALAARGERYEARLRDGERIEADAVLLALGPPPAGDPAAIPTELVADGTYVREPWAPGALERVRADERALIVGTGLTMVDVALSLGDEGPDLHAISRHGLVPRRHRETMTTIQRFPLPTESGELAPILLAVFEQVGRVNQQGGDWRDVIDSMRPTTPALWKALSLEEKRRFLGTMHRVWDVHRFRMAPAVADRFEALEASGRLRVEASSIVAVEPRPGGARVSLRASGERSVTTIEVDRILNCTGAGGDPRRHPLIADLLGARRARLDPLEIGLDVGSEGELLGADGVPDPGVHVIGALRKGVEWEAIGVTEIRDHSAAVASAVLDRLHQPQLEAVR